MYKGNALQHASRLSLVTIAVTFFTLLVCIGGLGQAYYNATDPALATGYATLSIISLCLAVIAAVVSDATNRS